MKKSTLELVVGVLILVATIGTFAYLVLKSVNTGKDLASTSQIYTPVDISGLKTQATKLISERSNNAGLPIPVPTEKMGKANPFNAPE